MAAYSDVLVVRRLLGEARPSWPLIGALFLLSLLSSPLALLMPLPLKIAVDSVIGSRAVPGRGPAVAPRRIPPSPRLLPGCLRGLLLLVRAVTRRPGLS